MTYFKSSQKLEERAIHVFPKLHKYKKIHHFTVVNLLYLDGSELNYSSIYKYNLEGVPILAPDSLETKATIEIKDDRQQESDRPVIYCIFCTSEFVGLHSH